MIKNKVSILIVDDELDICEMVAETLKDEQYNAIIATNYDMAVDILKNENINLLITDIWMNNDTNAGLKLLSFSQSLNPLNFPLAFVNLRMKGQKLPRRTGRRLN